MAREHRFRHTEHLLFDCQCIPVLDSSVALALLRDDLFRVCPGSDHAEAVLLATTYSGVSDQSYPRCCCHSLCCPNPARPCSCPGPYVPLAHEVAVFESCRSVPAWCVVGGVHPPAPPPRLCWHTFACLPGPPSVRGCSACGPGPILRRRACLRLILFCTCPPLCAGVLWPMPAWVWRDVRSGFLFFSQATSQPSLHPTFLSCLVCWLSRFCLVWLCS